VSGAITAASELVLADPQVTTDLRTYVSRARAADDGAIRLQAAGAVLAAYVCILRPRSLGEATPTVLGLRTMPLGRSLGATVVDTTVSLASVADRLARMAGDDVVLSLPPTAVSESWAGVTPPRTGWERSGTVDASILQQAARDGIRDVAEAVPASPGALVVNTARSAVWSRPVPGTSSALPAGAAFAAMTLGFLDPDAPSAVFRNGRWTRLSSSRGHVLVRSAAVL
jgi:hypothetical protein